MGSLFNPLNIDPVQMLFIGNSPGCILCSPSPVQWMTHGMWVWPALQIKHLYRRTLPSGVFGNTSGKGGYQRESRASFIFASDSSECPGSVMCHPHSLLCLQGRLLFINKLFINELLNLGVRKHLQEVTSELFSLSFPNYGILMPKINIESTVMGWIISFSL